MRLRETSDLIYKILITFLSIIALYFILPIENVGDVLSKVDVTLLIPAFILILINIFLSSFRFAKLSKKAGISISFWDAHHVNIYSQIFGFFVFNTIGQMAFRNAYGARFTNVSQRMAFLTLLEKVIALMTLLILATLGAVYITKSTFGNAIEISAILVIIAALLLSIIATYYFAITKSQRRYSRKILSLLKQLGINQTALISLLMHSLMLSAYLLLSLSFLKETSLLMATGIFAIVMLGAAIPISFAGWGLRELSAGFVFSYLGLDPTIGVIVASIVGVLSLLAVGVHALVISFSETKKETQVTKNKSRSKKLNIHFEKALAFFGAIFLAIFIGFQIHIPTNTGSLTFNLADPVAIVLSISFLALWYKEYLHQALWRVQGFGPAMFCLVIMIIYGWTLGFFKVGLIDWATYNRGLGLLIVFAYLISGSMITALLGPKMMSTVLTTFLLTTISILILYLSVYHFLHYETLRDLKWTNWRFNGMILNRNALAFAATLFLSVSIVYSSKIFQHRHNLIIGILFGVILLTASRTGIATASIILLISVFMNYLNFRNFFYSLLWTVSLVVTSYFLASIFPTIVADILGLNYSNALLTNLQTPELMTRVHSERVASYMWAIKMWKSNPIFGAGLGAFIAAHMNDFKDPLTIHNTALWVLTEMGVVGFILFLAIPLAFLSHLWKQSKIELKKDDFALILIGITFTLFSQTHDMLYQRVFWFLLGMLVTNTFIMNDTLASRFKHVS